MKSKYLALTLAAALTMNFFPAKVSRAAEAESAGELLEINNSLLKDEGVYTEIIADLTEAKNSRDFFDKITFERFLNFISLYRGAEEKPVERYHKENLVEEFTGNFIGNLEREIVFTSSLEAEAVNTGEVNFPYGKQTWDAIASTLVSRYELGRWFDKIVKRMQNATSISYTSKEKGARMMIGPFFEEIFGVYASAEKKPLRLISICNKNEARIGIERIFREKYTGNTLLYTEASFRFNENSSKTSAEKNENKFVLMLKKTF